MKYHRMILACLLFASLAVTGCSGRKSEQYRSEGDTLFRLAKYEDALGAYRRSQEMNPKNVQATLGIGQCLEAQKKLEEALKEFQAAITTDPTFEPAYREASHILVQTGRGDEALTLADQLAKTDAVAGAVLGSSILLDGKKAAEAIARLEKLSAEQQTNPSVQLQLAAGYKEAGNLAKAEELVRAYLVQAANPAASAAAQLLLVDLCVAQKKGDQMVAEFQARLAKDANDTSAELGLTETLMRIGRIDDAEPYAKKLYDRQPESGWGNYLLGTCLLAKKKYTEALPYLERAASVLPQQPQVARNLAAARSGDKGVPAPPAASQQTATASTTPQPPVPTALQPLPNDWRSLWKQAAFKPLLEHRNDFLATNEPNVAETLALAAFFVKDEAVLSELGPKIPPASPLNGYFKAIQTRQSAPFLEEMKGWTETDEERSVLRANAFGVGLALLGARFNAMHTLTSAATQYPAYGVTYYNLAQVLRASGAPAVGARALQKLLPQAISNVELHGMVYGLLREGSKYAEAQNTAEMTYSLFPGNETACLNLSQAYLDNQESKMADAVLVRAEQETPGSPQILLALARLRIYDNQPEKALELIASVPEGPEVHDARLFINVFAQAGLKNWASVLEQTPATIDVTSGTALRLIRSAALTAQGNTADVKALLDPITQIVPEVEIAIGALGGTAPSRPAEAELCQALQAKPETLVQYLYALSCLSVPVYGPGVSALQSAYDGIGGNPVLAGYILRVMAKSDPAANREESAKTLAEKHADSADVQLGIAEIYGSLKKSDLELKALEQAVSLSPDFAEAWRREGGLFEDQGNLDGAIAAYEKLLQLLPDDLAGNNNLAYCLMQAKKDMDRALACAQHAAALQPKSPQVLHTLGAIQLQRNELEESAKNLKMALALRPADPTLVLDYGKLLMAQGQKDEGLKHIAMSVLYGKQFDVPFPRKDEADLILKENGQAATPGT